MSTTVAITVPTVPDSVLLPNAQRRTHFRVWSPVAADLRLACSYAALYAIPATARPAFPTERLHVTADIWWPTGRRRCDFQAAVHAVKAPCDGFQGVVYTDDKQIEGMTIRQHRTTDRTGRMVFVITLAEIEEGSCDA